MASVKLHLVPKWETMFNTIKVLKAGVWDTP